MKPATNANAIVQALNYELQSLENRSNAIRALLATYTGTAAPSVSNPKRGRKPGRHMSAEAKAKIGKAMRKAWKLRKASKGNKSAKVRKSPNVASKIATGKYDVPFTVDA